MQYRELLANEYMGKIFYFSLKKTGNVHDAEDLTGEIVCEALLSLSRGSIPRDFDAWIWRLSRNRYAKWVDRRVRTLHPVAEKDIGEFEEILSDGSDVEKEYILSEDLRALRRELAFIRSDYRNILVAHYIEGKSVSVIARENSLLVETVKTRLKNGRKKLKEGMNMARDFGTLSYNPEQLAFVMSGCDGPHGEPWTFLNRLICKNIIFETYRNPATAEELSLEMGIALPYMEDELEKLTSSTLITKADGKYETNIIILSRDMQKRIYKRYKEMVPTLTDIVIKAVEAEKGNTLGNSISWEDQRWALLLYTLDKISAAAIEVIKREHGLTDKDEKYTSRPGGVNWDVLGYEWYERDEAQFVGCHSSWKNEKGEFLRSFSQYKIYFKNIYNITPEHLSYYEAKVLRKIAGGDLCLDEEERKLADNLVSYGYLGFKDGAYYPTLAILLDHKREDTPEIKEAIEMIREHYEYCWREIEKETPLRIKDKTGHIFFAVDSGVHLRGEVLEEAFRRGYLKYEESNRENKKYIGAIMYL